MLSTSLKIPKELENFKRWTFSSGGETGFDFKVFAKVYRRWLKETIRPYEIAKFRVNHYYLYAFLTDGKRFVYLSIPDVRFFKNGWANDILIRKAANIEDYKGDGNYFTTIENLRNDLEKLFKE